MNKSISQEQVSQMFNEISPKYDQVNRILSFGIDKRWRKKLIDHLPGTELRLLDCATGTCDQLLAMMKSSKISSAVGIDLAEDMLKVGQKKLDQSPYRQSIELKVCSATDLPFESNSFDCATMTFGIRNVQGDCLSEMHRVLKSGGRALILEFSLPTNPLIRSMHLFYLRRALPLIGGLISKKKQAYQYLNKTIESFPYGEAFLNRMRNAGFENPQAIPLTFGIATLYIGEKHA